MDLQKFKKRKACGSADPYEIHSFGMSLREEEKEEKKLTKSCGKSYRKRNRKNSNSPFKQKMFCVCDRIFIFGEVHGSKISFFTDTIFVHMVTWCHMINQLSFVFFS